MTDKEMAKSIMKNEYENLCDEGFKDSWQVYESAWIKATSYADYIHTRTSAAIAQTEPPTCELSALRKDAGRWRRLVNASELAFPILTIANDPENDCELSYGRKALEHLVDFCDEISDVYISQSQQSVAITQPKQPADPDDLTIAYMSGFSDGKKAAQPVQPAPTAQAEPACYDHPDAPHVFDRNASHSAHRYVCDCEGWMPDEESADPLQSMIDTSQELGLYDDAHSNIAQQKDKP